MSTIVYTGVSFMKCMMCGAVRCRLMWCVVCVRVPVRVRLREGRVSRLLKRALDTPMTSLESPAV